MTAADAFFGELGLQVHQSAPRTRTYQGIVGTPEIVANVRLSAVPEGGHFTFVEAISDQIGESRLDRNIKRFFVELRRAEDPRRLAGAAY
ncbi:MAG: hypothetical protein MNPFHGCM_03148 [Gemmatimonadaceae bacterium]|nr:hypothetical protein [Gemmatimonadaceae bacterium]